MLTVAHGTAIAMVGRTSTVCLSVTHGARQLTVPLFAILLLMLPMHQATADIFMKIPGYGGNSLVNGYEDYIEVDSWAWGLSRDLPGSATSGVTDPIPTALVITRASDEVSAEFAGSLFSGAQAAIEIAITQAVGENQFLEVTKIELGKASITDVAQSGASAASRPLETISFHFDCIKITQTEIKSDGTAGAKPITLWNFLKNIPNFNTSCI